MKFMFWKVPKIKFISSSIHWSRFDIASLDNWVGWLGCNTAVVSHVSGHLDVSSSSPSCSPGVLDQEVVAASFRSVSDGKDGVVETTGRTASAVMISKSKSVIICQIIPSSLFRRGYKNLCDELWLTALHKL